MITNYAIFSFKDTPYIKTVLSFFFKNYQINQLMFFKKKRSRLIDYAIKQLKSLPKR